MTGKRTGGEVAGGVSESHSEGACQRHLLVLELKQSVRKTNDPFSVVLECVYS